MLANSHLAPTKASKEVLDEYNKWCSNPVTQDHVTGMVSAFDALMEPEFKDKVPFWTKGLEEAFLFGLESCVTNYGYLIRKPHIIISTENNPAAVGIVRRLVTQKRCEASFLIPEEGRLDVQPEQYKKAIKRNTCAICVPMMDFWSGRFIDVKSIAKTRLEGKLIRIPVLTDITSLWGRYGKINLDETGADMWFLDYRHISGIEGLGCCLVNKKLQKDFAIEPMVKSIRPNVAVVAATFAAWKQKKTPSLDGIEKLHDMLTQYGWCVYTPLTKPPSYVILVETDEVNPIKKLLKNKIIADALPPECPYTSEGTMLQLSFSSLNSDQARKVFSALTD